MPWNIEFQRLCERRVDVSLLDPNAADDALPQAARRGR
jgi:hypothetical protein